MSDRNAPHGPSPSSVHHWLTMRARRAFDDIEDEEDHTAEDAAGLQMARLRVRRTLELPLDGYDALVASALLDEHGSSD